MRKLRMSTEIVAKYKVPSLWQETASFAPINFHPKMIIPPTFELSPPVEWCMSRRQSVEEAWPKDQNLDAHHCLPKNPFLGCFSSLFHHGAPSSHDPPGHKTECEEGGELGKRLQYLLQGSIFSTPYRSPVSGLSLVLVIPRSCIKQITTNLVIAPYYCLTNYRF